jgi:hypothetical protein
MTDTTPPPPGTEPPPAAPSVPPHSEGSPAPQSPWQDPQSTAPQYPPPAQYPGQPWPAYGTPPPAKRTLSTGAVVAIVLGAVLVVIMLFCAGSAVVGAAFSGFESSSVGYDDGYDMGDEAADAASTPAEAELYCRGAAEYSWGPESDEAADAHEGCLDGWKDAQ